MRVPRIDYRRVNLLGFRIFRHSLVQVTGNFKNAVRVSAVLWGATTIPVWLLTAQGPAEFSPDSSGISEFDGMGIPIAILSVIVAFAFLSIVALPWIAVAWHRYVLKNELALSAFQIPKTSASAVLGYLWKGIVLSCVLMLVVIPITILFVFLGAGFLNSGSAIAAFSFIVIVATIGAYFMMRFALILPARAVDRPMSVGESWRYTSKVGPALWLTAFLLVLVNIGLGALSESLVPGNVASGAISLVFAIIINWITMMVGISILTTLYGYCVEDRELV